MNFLKGKKTYISAGICGLITVAKYLGYIDPATYTLLLGVFAPVTAVALRAGVVK